jgi:nicotinamidase-related amidase
MKMKQNIKDAEFLDFLENWLVSLPAAKLADVLVDPGHTAITSIDLTNGFCNSGALASPRVHDIVDPAVALFKSAWALGLRQIVLIQDTHEPDAVEFSQWPPHCVRGTEESETVSEIKELPFYPQMITFAKDSIHPAMNTGFQGWLDAHPELDTFIVTGDCTDLCTYQLAMHLRLDANARRLKRRVIAPADCIQTYDMPVPTSQALGAVPHPGDLMHSIFLYHMALNGIEVVRTLEAA